MDTTPRGADHAERFLSAARNDPASTLVALDFDGTLSEMVADPEQAYIHPHARQAVIDLVARIGLVAIITGRPVDQVTRLGRFDDEFLQHIVVLGQYGAERLDRNGRHVPEASPAVRAAMSDLAPLRAEYPGLFLEDKDHALGVHTRRAPQGTLEAIEPTVLEVAKTHGLDIEPGKEVLELRAHRISKGDALRALMQEFGSGAVAMVGDDLGDLPAFDVVAEHQRRGRPGVVVVSGSDERPELVERADVLCGGPAGVAEWLDSVAPN